MIVINGKVIADVSRDACGRELPVPCTQAGVHELSATAQGLHQGPDGILESAQQTQIKHHGVSRIHFTLYPNEP